MNDDEETIIPINSSTDILLPDSVTIRSNPAFMYLFSLNSTFSHQTMKYIILRISRIFGYSSIIDTDWSILTRQHVQVLIKTLQKEKKAPSTISLYLSAIKGIALEAWSLNIITTDEYQRIKAVKNPKGIRLSRGRALSSDEQSRLLTFNKNNSDPIHIRNMALLSLLIGCGFRRSEIVSINIDNINFNDHSIQIIGKGNKERISFVPDWAWSRLETWLEIRPDNINAIFLRIRRENNILDQRLSHHGVYFIVKKYQHILHLDNLSPHDLRRTFATSLLEYNIDLLTIKDAMGHSNVSTTQIYDKRGVDKLKLARNKLNNKII